MISLPWGVLDRDVAVPMRDGAVLSANVFRPDTGGRFPVLMTLGPYGKDVHLSQFMPEAASGRKRNFRSACDIAAAFRAETPQ